MLFDVTNHETNKKLSKTFRNHMHSECKTKSEQMRHVTLSPVLFSGEPVVQSGCSPIIRSGGEPMVLTSGLEPVIQSGFPVITQSGEETKVVEYSGGTMIQSGYSPHLIFWNEKP